MRTKDQVLLEQAYVSIYEALTPDQAIDKLSPHGKEVVNQLRDYLNKGAKKASFYYRSTRSGREARYTVNLGISYANAKQKSHAIIQDYISNLPQGNPEKAVGEKILQGSNRKPNSNPPTQLGSGITIQDTKMNPGNYKLYIYASVDVDPERDEEGNVMRDEQGKVVQSSKPTTQEVVAPQTQKSFSPAEILNYKLKTPLSRFRRFILDPENIAGITYKGGVMEFQNQGEEAAPNEAQRAERAADVNEPVAQEVAPQAPREEQQ